MAGTGPSVVSNTNLRSASDSGEKLKAQEPAIQTGLRADCDPARDKQSSPASEEGALSLPVLYMH